MVVENTTAQSSKAKTIEASRLPADYTADADPIRDEIVTNIWLQLRTFEDMQGHQLFAHEAQDSDTDDALWCQFRGFIKQKHLDWIFVQGGSQFSQ